MSPASSLHCWIYFIYGLTFFSMGLAILLEVSRGPDSHLRNALRPLAAFGLLHGLHEWLEMFGEVGRLPLQGADPLAWPAIRLALLAFSFLSLSAFGAALFSQERSWRRVSLLVPLVHAAVWGLGVLALRGRYPPGGELLAAGEAWTRYVLGIVAPLLASAGLIVQQRDFRSSGMAQFGRDSLWAALGFGWYGLVGQIFVPSSSMPPSNVLNQELFYESFGFPIQIVRAGAALVAAVFVMRFLRAFEVEIRQQMEELRAARVREAERREQLRGEMLRRVVAAQEAERRRVARELHDETGQALTAIGMGLRAVERLLDPEGAKARQNLRRLEGLVEGGLEELQRIIADLRPTHLDDLGLPAALRWYAGEIEDRTGLPIAVKVEGEIRSLESPVSTALFRIVQEGLTNIFKHARATEARISVQFGGEFVELEILDDGQGFDRDEMALVGYRCWGLMGMEERAALLDGTMQLDTRPGEGTCLRVRIPYKKGDATHDDD